MMIKKNESSLAVVLKGLEKAKGLKIISEKRRDTSNRLMSASRFNFNTIQKLPYR